MADSVDKQAVLEAVRAQLQEELDRFTRRALDAAEAATHEENKPEGDKDMRATEASYVARGQAERVHEIEQALALLASVQVRSFAEGDAIAATAVVEVSAGTTRAQTYFVLPVGGGVKVRVAGLDLLTIATSAPLGAALVGLSEGDEAEVRTPQGLRTYEIISVR